MSGLFDSVGQAFADFLAQPIVGLTLWAVVAYATVLWLAAAYWTFRDLRSRTRDPISPYLAAAAVVLLTPLLFPLAILAYRVLRPPRTVAERRAEELEWALLEGEAAVETCPSCGAPVDADWIRCPACTTAVAARCHGCGNRIRFDWAICPWCAAEVPWATGAPAWPVPAEPAAVVAPGPAPIEPADPAAPVPARLVPVMAEPDEAWTGPVAALSRDLEAAARAVIDGVRQAGAAMTADPEPVPWADAADEAPAPGRDRVRSEGGRA